MKCCLCGNDIEVKPWWDQGNNAQPLADGRCCDVCDMTKVIPARLFGLGVKLGHINEHEEINHQQEKEK